MMHFAVGDVAAKLVVAYSTCKTPNVVHFFDKFCFLDIYFRTWAG